MSFDEVIKISLAILASLGSGALIVFSLSNWLGKVWADRLMQGEKAKHDAELEQLRAILRQRTEGEIEVIKRELDIATTTHLREVQEKVEIYRLVVDLVANILADFDRPLYKVHCRMRMIDLTDLIERG